MTVEMSLATQRQMVEALRNPVRYPHPVGSVTLIETHISFVLLTGTIAYKIKKAVDLGFVDYTSLEKRLFFCHEELRLNRRLAPRLYLDVVALSGSPEDPHFKSTNAPIEYALKLRQFDQQDLLSHARTCGKLTTRHVDQLAAKLADFHRTAPVLGVPEACGSPALILTQMEALFDHFRMPPGVRNSGYAALETWCRKEYARLRDVFELRKKARFVRECHGDLHLGNMAFVDEDPLIFDCIEFNPALRWIDVASDIAFLIMDLAAHGRTTYASRLLNGWLECTGDYAALELLRFYQVYRALVRAKVASLRSSDPALSARDQTAASTSLVAYLDYACTLMAPNARAIIITHGLSGAGKSTLARAAVETLGAVCLRSDIERKRLHGQASRPRLNTGIGTGLYAESATQATYDRLQALSLSVLAAGYPVVIDATFLRRPQRQRFADLARQAGVPFLILDCHAPRGILQQRIAARAELGSDASEANLAVLEWQTRDADPLSPEELDAVVSVDTLTRDHSRQLAKIRQNIVRISP